MQGLRRLLVICAAAVPLLAPAQASAQATPCADLQITDIAFSPVNPVQGQPANIAITVRNAGTCAAGGFVVQFRTNLFAPTGPSRSVASLAAGASTTLNLSFNFAQSGDFQTVVQVDTGNAVAETNEVNNLEIEPVTVLPPGVNLVIDQFTLAPDPVVQGRLATASIRVTNTGNVPAGAFRVEWTPFFLGAPLSRQINGLAPGASTVVTFDFTFPFAGTVDGTAVVDAGNAVSETNEFDNTTTRRTVVEPPLPNLAFAAENAIDIDVGPAGSVTTANITVVNDGNNPAGDFVVRWQPSFLSAPLTQQVNGLAVGASTTVSFDFTFPFAFTFDGNVTIDSTNAVAEVDETDNSRPTQVVVPAATVDLTVEALTISPASPTQGAPATASVTVRNLGNSPSGRFVVDWNPDAFGIIVPGVQTLSEETGPLGPGEARVITFSFTYPQAGNFRSIARVDSFNAVAETNEANNDRILNVTVQPAPIDLVFVGPIVLNPAQPVRGVDATATMTVRNDGPIATGPFGVQFKAQEADFFPQTQFINGLNPGESRTLTFTTNYFTAGTFTASATLDIFNQVNEAAPGGEANNVRTQSVTVVPQSATLDVRLDNLRVFNDLDPPPILSGDGEWNPIIFAVLDPTTSCAVNIDRGPLDINETIPGVRCVLFNGGSIDDGAENATITTNRTLRVRLEELTPLVAAVAVLEDDDPFTPDFPGFATLVSLRPDYLSLPQQNLPGQSCATITLVPPGINPVGDGHCFDARVTVIPVSVVGPAAASASRGAALTRAAARRWRSANGNAGRRNAVARRAYIKRANVPSAVKRRAVRRAARLRRVITGLKREIARQARVEGKRGTARDKRDTTRAEVRKRGGL
jgi:subtilase family serine protease